MGQGIQGNIFCIDPLRASDWVDGSAPRSKRRQSIRLATQRLASEFSEFMEYAKSRAIRTRSRFYEYLLSYLVFRQIDYGTLASSPSVHGLSQDQLDIL